MNALWITRMSAYKNSTQCVEAAKRIIAVKVGRQDALLKKYRAGSVRASLENTGTIESVSLEEARAAKKYWAAFRALVPAYAAFPGRKPRSSDIGNRLLDIGYHHVTNLVKKILEAHDVSPALGLLHAARKSDSAPLAYDLVEIFRADIVDAEVLRFLRLKKKALASPGQEEIRHFLHEINKRLERHYYLKDFKRCHTYRYYMELQILKFIGAVNHAEPFRPLHLPSRHEGRCRRLTHDLPVVSSD